MTDITLRIEHNGGGTSTLDGITGEYTRSLKDQARGEVRVYRDDWTAVQSSINERNDKFYLVVNGTDEFGGRYDDSESDGDTVSVRLNSPEIDAAEAKPTTNNKTYTSASADKIATDAVSAVNTLSIGTINTSPTGLSYSVSHGSQSKILYDLREMTGIEFRYNSNFSVDVLDRIGSNKAVTLGPGQRNIGEDFRKTKDIREEVTHVRVLGGQSGPNQVTAESTAANYAGGRPVWRRYPKKEIIDQSRAQAIADSLIAEYNNEPQSIEVECTVFDEDLALGDRVSVDYPAENINRELRLVSLTTEITRRGYILLCTLSSRSLTRERRETKRNDDIDTHNRGHGGFVDRDQTTSGWNAAGDGTPQTLEIMNWPDDIVTENTVELSVLGRAWRSPVSSAGHDHPIPELQIKSGENTDSDGGGSTVSSTTVSGVSTSLPASTWTTVASPSSSSTSTSGADFISGFTLTYNGSKSPSSFKDVTVNTDVRVVDSFAGSVAYPDSNGVSQDIIFTSYDDSGNGTYDSYHTNSYNQTIHISEDTSFFPGWELQVKPDDDLFAVGGAKFVEYGEHGHLIGGRTIASDTTDSEISFSPGVIDTFSGTQYYPTDVEIAINGATIATVAGDSTQEWQDTIDISGQLTAGQNTITATPTGDRGEVNLILASELFRRGDTT
jgi:hypothetical protein